jgi:hypothetical protein
VAKFKVGKEDKYLESCCCSCLVVDHYFYVWGVIRITFLMDGEECPLVENLMSL